MSAFRNPDNRYIKKKSILLILLITLIFMPFFLRLMIRINFNSIRDNLYENNLNSFKSPKISGTEINITTPENKTYYTLNGGHYPGTYSFENDPTGMGVTPSGWFHWQPSQYGVYEEIAGHKKVYGIYKADALERRTIQTFTAGAQTTGTIEFYMATDDASQAAAYELYNQFSPPTYNWPLLIWFHEGVLKVDNGSATRYTISSAVESNRWYHIRIDFRMTGAGPYLGLAENTMRVYLDSVDKGIYNCRGSFSSLTQFAFRNAIGSSGMTCYIDGLGYSWDPSYNIGDNIGDDLLLNFKTNINLNWIGYSLDGQANKTIFGNTTIPVPQDGSHKIQIFGNNTLGTMYQSDVRHFSVSSILPELTLLTPENKTYYEPMSGYYPAIYGFENDDDDSNPKDWTVDETGGVVIVRASAAGYNKVLDFHDQSNTQAISASKTFADQANGTVEFWMRTSDASQEHKMSLRGGGPAVLAFRINGDQFHYYDNTGFHDLGVTPTNNRWYHVSISFESTGGGYQGLLQYEWKLFLNGNEYGAYSYMSEQPYVDRIYFESAVIGSTNYHNYVDAIGCTWDPNYNVGDNLEEGLLLSFNNNTTLDWMGYSLDGQANKTILGNTTIPMPANGPHRIQVFVNDSSGLIYKSEILYFTADLPSPPPPPPPPPPLPPDDDDGENDEEADFGFWILIILLLILINLGVIAAAAYVIKYRGKKELKPKKRPPPKKKLREKKKKRIKKKLKKKVEKGGFINCPFCYNKIRGSEQFCPYCGSPLSEKIKLSDPTLPKGLDKKKTDFYNEDDYYEKIFLQSSNILKIWIFDAKNKTKLYEETLDPNFSDIEQKYIDINNIINADYEKNKLIEESFEFEKNIIYLYIYASNNPVILVLFSGKKFDEDYFEFIVKTIKGIDENYRDLSDDPLEMKKFLDEHIFLFNSRIFGDIPSSYREMINEIFKNKDEMELVLRDLKNLPKETFPEFLKLHKKLTTELLLEKTRYMINNHNFFMEGFE